MNVSYQYAVKVVCGKADDDVVAPGEYWTAINVHNPTRRPVRFRKKVATALPHEEPGPVSEFADAKLGPDEALEIDREDIFEHADAEKEFLKGFVVIESEVELDVVAVYTAAGRERGVETFHTERVSPRRREREGLPDLVPVPDKETDSFCRIDDGTLVVTVRNQGSGGAGPTTTEVDFGRHGTVRKPTKELTPGESTDLEIPIPRGCFDPDCQFRIAVDADDDVTESDEGNNVVSDLCLG
jgi:hypothetical protein